MSSLGTDPNWWFLYLYTGNLEGTRCVIIYPLQTRIAGLVPGLASQAKHPLHTSLLFTSCHHILGALRKWPQLDSLWKKWSPQESPPLVLGMERMRNYRDLGKWWFLDRNELHVEIQLCIYRPSPSLQEQLAFLQPCFIALMRNLECCAGGTWELEDLWRSWSFLGQSHRVLTAFQKAQTLESDRFRIESWFGFLWLFFSYCDLMQIISLFLSSLCSTVTWG